MSTFVNKNHIQKTKEGKEERKNDWMDDTEDRPNLAATLLGGLLSPLRMGLYHTKGLWSVHWVPRMSLCASLLVLTVKFWSHILLPSHFPDQLCLPPQDWHLARIFKLVCPPAVWQLPHDSMCIYAFSLISWYKFFKVACQGQNCLAKRQAVLSLFHLTWRKYNLFSVFTLPSLSMYLAHSICLLSVNNTNDPGFPISHTHIHTTLKYTTKTPNFQ